MTPERWRQITTAFHAARASAPQDRSAVLDKLCEGDASLRGEIEALLGADGEASRGGTAAVGTEAFLQLSPGTTFSEYRIDSFIGAGGMGQVYRATDTRLGRTVALKLLRPDVALDANIAARFEREGHLLAALNHPNIAAIHGLAEADGMQALVLEFVDGPSWSARSPMPLAAALSVALQIASALEAAHARGIVHRDLKPGNIKIDRSGRVKVLDFGIAHANLDTSNQETTRQSPMTTPTGVVIGTPAYMSPEQARGLPIDNRADIWAFGCVLFEMLTSRVAFAGDTASDSLARVIEREPDWSVLPAHTPPAIARLLQRCLRKNPDERLHHIADARIEIADATSAPAREDPRTSRGWRPSRLAASAVLGAIVGATIVGLWWHPWSATSTTRTAPTMEFGITFPNNYLPTFGLAISPNGRQIAASLFSSINDIWLQTLDGSLPRPLPGGERGVMPFWSPDSATVAFFQATRLVSVRPDGGPVTRIAGVSGAGEGGTWNRDGVILYSDSGKLFQVRASGGGTPVEVSVSTPGDLAGPTFLPDGRHFTFCERGSNTLSLASLDGGPVRVLGPSECPGGFAAPNFVLFVRNGSVLAQKIDLEHFTLLGDPAVVESDITRGVVGPFPVIVPSASATGVLAVVSSRAGSVGHLTWFGRDGRPRGAIEPPNDESEYLNPVLSPDGRLVATNLIDPHTGVWHIWLIDTQRGNAATRLTTDPASDFDPVWSPDGTEVLYTSDRSGHDAFYRQPIAGGSAVLVRDPAGGVMASATDWSRDGHVFFQDQQHAFEFPLAEPPHVTSIADIHVLTYGARLSPDGRWLAYAESAQGRFDVFVERFPGGGLRKQVSTGDGGAHPRWTTTSHGVELAYWAPPGGVKSVELELSDGGIQVGATHTLVDTPVLTLVDLRPHYDITRDGQRVLARQPNGPQRPGIRVIVNFLSKLPQ